MILIRRAAALMLALVFSTLPLALERCRAACVQASASHAVPSSAHACHESADAEEGPALMPSPRACGHSDEARAADLNAISSGLRLDYLIAPPPNATATSLARVADEPAPARPPGLSSVDTPGICPSACKDPRAAALVSSQERRVPCTGSDICWPRSCF